MKKISVVGIGPGGRDYMTPAAARAIEESDIVVGGRRNLEAVDTGQRQTFEITGRLSEAERFIRDNMEGSRIAVIVSGDTGFYSLLSYLSKSLGRDRVRAIPGISSMQYMFARVADTWHDAYISSVHAREENIAEIAARYPKVGLLTDKKRGPASIAKELVMAGLGDRMMYIGENLSYENERITARRAREIEVGDEHDMCVVVIKDE